MRGLQTGCKSCHQELGVAAHGDFGECTDCHTTAGFDTNTFDHGAVKYTGQRYGDHLESLYSSSDVNEVKAAAYLRFQWWMGEDVPIAGEGYAEAVDKVNSMNRRARSELRSKLGKWWQEYRAKTELK